MGHTLRRLESLEDYKACETLQQHAWGFSDGLDIVPQTQLVTAQKWGGLVLGAFSGDGELHGFCYGFLGRDKKGRIVHCSHMLAVDERARNAGLGARLKWAQRDACLEDEVAIAVWTFDPLESVNACLNFSKLGGLSDDYVVNLYGETTSRLHTGTATDRLTLWWFLDSPRVQGRADEKPSEAIAAVAAGDIDAPWALEAAGVGPGEPELDLDAERIRCEIPASVQAVKADDPAAALRWREATRAVFTTYLERGYFARECVRTDPDTGGGRRTVYLLERGEMEVDGTRG